MIWRRPYRGARLRDYYLGFAALSPVGFIFSFGALKLLFGAPLRMLVALSVVFCTGIVLGGAPLLFLAHKRSLRTGTLRSTVLAVELMFLWGLMPVGYLLTKTEGFDFWPFVGTLLIVLVSFAPLYWYQPKRAREYLSEIRRNQPHHD